MKSADRELAARSCIIDEARELHLASKSAWESEKADLIHASADLRRQLVGDTSSQPSCRRPHHQTLPSQQQQQEQAHSEAQRISEAHRTAEAAAVAAPQALASQLQEAAATLDAARRSWEHERERMSTAWEEQKTTITEQYGAARAAQESRYATQLAAVREVAQKERAKAADLAREVDGARRKLDTMAADAAATEACLRQQLAEAQEALASARATASQMNITNATLQEERETARQQGRTNERAWLTREAELLKDQTTTVTELAEVSHMCHFAPTHTRAHTPHLPQARSLLRRRDASLAETTATLKDVQAQLAQVQRQNSATASASQAAAARSADTITDLTEAVAQHQKQLLAATTTISKVQYRQSCKQQSLAPPHNSHTQRLLSPASRVT